MEKYLDSNYTRMLRAILNKSWRQQPTRHQLYGYLPPITKTIQVRRTRHAGHSWRSRDELISDVPYGPPHMARQKLDDQLEHTYSSSVRIRDVALKTCQRRWTIGRSGERGSGISVPAPRHDDIYIYIYTLLESLVYCCSIWTWRSEFKFWVSPFRFHIALITLQSFFLQQWINSRADWAFQPRYTNPSWRRKTLNSSQLNVT